MSPGPVVSEALTRSSAHALPALSGTSGLTTSCGCHEALSRPRRRLVRSTMPNQNHGSRPAHGFPHSAKLVLEPQPRTRPPERPRPSPPEHTRAAPGQAPAWLCTEAWLHQPLPPKCRGEASEAASGGSGHKHARPKTHPQARKEQWVWSPCCHASAKFKVACQVPQVWAGHHKLA